MGVGEVVRKALLVILCLLLISTIFLVNYGEEKRKIPPEIETKVEELFLKPEAANIVGTTRWKADFGNKTITIFVWNVTATNKKYDGMKIDTWTVRVTEDVELKEEMRAINTKLESEIPNASWIISINPRTGEKSVKVLVDELTPKAKKLNNTTIDGWKIYVYRSISSK